MCVFIVKIETKKRFENDRMRTCKNVAEIIGSSEIPEAVPFGIYCRIY
ncbi:MAG: hypothetical protein PHO18_01445 [Synergistaceae bacterium]|nr:hypothetical protein [Synergistaceae bacterium]